MWVRFPSVMRQRRKTNTPRSAALDFRIDCGVVARWTPARPAETFTAKKPVCHRTEAAEGPASVRTERGRSVADTINAFFKELGEQGYNPLLGHMQGKVRFDLSSGNGGGEDQWLVAVDHGAVTVSDQKGDADCTIDTGRPLFERVIHRRGERDGGGLAWRHTVHG